MDPGRRYLDESTARKPVPPAPAVKPRPDSESSFHTGPHGLLHVRQAGAPRRIEDSAGYVPHEPKFRANLRSATDRDGARPSFAWPRILPASASPMRRSSPPTIEDYAACMGGLIDDLGFKRVDVMGYHTGSQTAMEIARQRPDLVGKVVMVSAPLYTAEEQEVRHARNKPLVVEEDGSHLIKRFAGLWKFYGDEVEETVVARNFCESLRGGPVAWWGHRAAFTYANGGEPAGGQPTDSGAQSGR